MSRVRYRPLDHSRNEIRLLSIDITDAEEHSLVQNVSLTDLRQSFAALSYPWGSPEPVTVLIDGRLTRVSKNLRQAIKAVVAYYRNNDYSRRRRPLLWCDQICINQGDHDEKGHQVNFMRTIYSRAALVFAWLDLQPMPFSSSKKAADNKSPRVSTRQMKSLGKSQVDTISIVPVTWGRAMKLCLEPIPQGSSLTNRLLFEPCRLRGWSEWQQWHIKHIKRGPEAWVEKERATATTSEEDLHELIDGIVRPRTANNSKMDKSFIAINHMCRLALSSWWTRAWVYQELMLASRVVFLFDDQAATSSQLLDLVNKITPDIRSFASRVKKLMPTVVLAEAGSDSEAQESAEEYADTGSRSARRARLSSRRRSSSSCSSTSSRSSRPSPRPSARSASSLSARRLDRPKLKIPRAQLEGLDSIMLVLYQELNKWLDSIWSSSQSVTDNAWDRMVFMLQHKAYVQANNPDAELSSLAKHMRHCQSTDGRDRVFALLGIISRSYKISPDYRPSNSLVDVLVSASVAVIETEKTLDFLISPRERLWLEKGPRVLPSWTLNLTTPDAEDKEYQRFMKTASFPRDCSASQMEPPFAFFLADKKGRPNRRLACRGVKICRLENVLGETDDGAARIYGAANGRFDIVTTPSTQQGDEVWVLYGLSVPFVLAKISLRDNDYELGGPALVREHSTQEISNIMTGRIVDLVRENRAKEEVVWIV